MISYIHMRAITRQKMEKLEKEIETHAKEWIKNRLCLCHDSSSQFIECEHLLNDRIKKYGKKIEKIYKMFDYMQQSSFKSLAISNP